MSSRWYTVCVTVFNVPPQARDITERPNTQMAFVVNPARVHGHVPFKIARVETALATDLTPVRVAAFVRSLVQMQEVESGKAATAL